VATTIERETAGGRLIQTIMPTAWRIRDAPRLAEVGMKLKRRFSDIVVGSGGACPCTDAPGH
jgi:hypothetical protein